MGIQASTVILLLSILVASTPAPSFAFEGVPRMLDKFDNMNAWRVFHSDDIDASLHAEDGAVCLDFDFNRVSGFASIRRKLRLSLSGNYALSFRVRGESSANTLQLKLIDASGDNVWWINRPDFTFTSDWQTVRAERRQIDFAWGPAKDRTLRRTAALEIALAAGKGGSGRICFDDLKLENLPPPRTSWPAPVVRASSELPNASAALIFDNRTETAWRSDPTKEASQTLTIDFVVPRSFGGLVLHWLPGLEATRYAVQFSEDGLEWSSVRRVTEGNGGDDPLLLTESHTRYVRLMFEDGPAHAYGLSEVEVKNLVWGATPNGFFERLAKDSRRGLYPRCLSGEQPYWTVVGVDGGGDYSALLSEDGAVELNKGSFSVEPFLLVDGHLLTWADVASIHALDEGYLPMPSVTWETSGLKLRNEVFAAGDKANSRLLMQYIVENRTNNERTVTLALTVRPFQVNPPTQLLNSPGGISPIHTLDWDGSVVSVNGEPRVFPLQAPDSFVASRFDAGNVVERLEAGDYPQALHVTDDFGYASGAMLFHLALPANGRRRIALLAPLSGIPTVPEAARKDPDSWVAHERSAVVSQWRAKINGVALRLPKSEQATGDTLRTSLAYILISRHGPALQPGTRSYARTWIRDGAMMSEGLLRMGCSDVVRDFITWYAPHQFTTGKVPCCVDERGSDPVPENDSHGQFIFTVAELYRFTHDRATLEALWPHVLRAIDYMDRLRASQRTPANRSPKRIANYGLMPASISHEGYSAKPMHSYWDDFWALKGYDDAASIALTLGKSDQARRIAGTRDQFRSDLHASIRNTIKQHNIDYLPGCVELGDFDPSSTTIALSPLDEQVRLPQGLLEKTFARYWREFIARRSDKKDKDAYTPYELRTVSAFARLGWRGRIQALLDFFMPDRRPAAWNGWAEVVRHDPRAPGFVGDMPHAWIASDYIRSVLDMFAYLRAADGAMVLAAGTPTAWLEDEGVGISGLLTPWGRLDYTLRREDNRLHLRINADASPTGGFVLPWPYAGDPGEAQIEGKVASWRDGELHIDAAHAKVIIKAPGGGGS